MSSVITRLLTPSPRFLVQTGLLATSSILPGGFSVFNNTLVILGGFDIPNGIGSNQIWQFTPGTNVWMQKAAVLPVPLGYIPTTTIGSLIYTGGGADITGGVLTDTTNAFVYNPVADSINTITPITDATSNTRAVNFCGLMYVLGGNFNAPTNEVQIYDPVSNTWSVGTPFAIAGRNFAADTDGTNHIWKAGGYDSGLAIIASMEIFNCPVSPCGAPSPTPTATATATATALQRQLLPRRRGIHRRHGLDPHLRLGRKVCFSSRFFGDSRQLASPRNMYLSCYTAPPVDRRYAGGVTDLLRL